MKTFKRTVQAIDNEIELVVIGDTHIGSPNFNESLLNYAINYILEKENRFCILNGDILDCTFKESVGNIYENYMTPSVALSYALLRLKPLADAGRILCSLGGNHDHDRSMKLADISYSQQLAVGLGISEWFSSNSAIFFLKVADGIKNKKDRSIVYKIFVSHGNNGGGGQVGSKATALEKMSLIVPSADLYIHSHTHSPLSFKDEYIDLNEEKSVFSIKERVYVNTNTYLNYIDSYGEGRLMKPQSLSVPIIKLKAVRVHNKTQDKIYKRIKCEI